MRKKGISYKLVFISLILLAFSSFAHANTIIYVDDDANGTNDGSSWLNAYKYLQDALADANSAEKPVEIRIAQGTYKPDQGAGQTAGDREATFQLINEVTLSGGYAGIIEPDPNQRDSEKYETMLSGDLAGDDVENPYPMISEVSRRENSGHVVTNKKTAILEGLSIAHGAARFTNFEYGSGILNIDTGNLTLLNCIIFGNGNRASDGGGGIYNSNGELNIKDCIIRKNSSGEGGGLYNSNGYVNIKDCIIEENSAPGKGGGLCNYQGSVDMTNCILEENSAGTYGGGLYNQLGSLNLIDCIFNKNFNYGNDGYGGGIYNYDYFVTIMEQKLINCTFTGNSSGGGGGMYNNSRKTLLIDCKFIGNIAYREGGGLYNGEGGKPVLNNCTFIGNTALRNGGGISNPDYGGTNIILNNCYLCGNLALQNGGGIYNLTGLTHVQRNIMLNNCVLCGNKAGNLGGGIFDSGNKTILSNTILWANTATQGNQISLSGYISNFGTYTYYSYVSFQYCNIQGGDSGIYKEYEECEVEWIEGNVDTDPLFADTGYWDPNGTPEDANDDFWIDGDYHLKSQAGRYVPNTQAWVQDDVTSPCIDAGDPNSPIGLEAFPNGGRINMGAYGGTNEASKSYFGKPVCETIVAGDINGDCIVDILDLEIMLLHWLEEH